LNEELLYAMADIVGWTDENRFLPSSRDAAVMWASGLGSTQTTPSTSTQAAPAPKTDCGMHVADVFAQLELLTNQVMERCYDC